MSNGNGYLTSVALIISLLIAFMFSLKNKVSNTEAKIFKKMLIINILEALTTTLIVIIATTINSTFILKILNRIDVILIIMWCSSMFYYIYSITSRKINDYIKNAIKLFNISLIILSLILNVEIIVEDGILNSTGTLTYLGLFGAIVYIILMILTLIFLKDKKENIEKDKYIPLYFLIGMLILVAVLRIIIPEINFISIIISLVDLIMIFTVENPDVKLVNKLNLSLNEIKKLNKGQTELLTRLGHEIRTPLNAIVGFSQLIENSDSLEEAKENSKYVIDSSNILLKMVDNIIDISRLNNEGIEINNKDYELEKLVHDVIDSFKYDLDDKDIDIKVNIKSVPKILIGDSIKIKRILFNIIDNAIKYTEKGKITVDIIGKIEKYKCNLTITIEDTGKGISSDLQKKLFTNFTRAEEDINSSVSGIGLGLSLTKNLLDLLNGSIKIESEKGKGTRVIIKLKQKVG